jgi:hypothetical protein
LGGGRPTADDAELFAAKRICIWLGLDDVEAAVIEIVAFPFARSTGPSRTRGGFPDGPRIRPETMKYNIAERTTGTARTKTTTITMMRAVLSLGGGGYQGYAGYGG